MHYAIGAVLAPLFVPARGVQWRHHLTLPSALSFRIGTVVCPVVIP